jgi:phytoene dehydrogenase-like protein
MRAHVIGSGPNGLVAGITLARAGWDVTVFEAAATPGGGARTSQLTLPNVLHDVCSAIHPLALASPALRALPLADHGLEWIHPEIPLGHPLDQGHVALLHRSMDHTAAELLADGPSYLRLFGPFVEAGSKLTDELLTPLRVPPAHPLTMARFGWTAIRSAVSVAEARFGADPARALFGGLAAHSILPLTAPATAGYGLTLGVLAHTVGWPLARGGSGRIAEALVSILGSLGGSVECAQEVSQLDELPEADATLLDLTPRQVLAVAGDRLPSRYSGQLAKYRYGSGVFKIDWALDGPIPWTNSDCQRAGTLHLGGSLAEIARAEEEVARGHHAERPFVLLSQPSLFDSDRAPQGTHTAWAYCHVPNGSTTDMTRQIEDQVERFAPDFRDVIIARHTMTTQAMQAHNANYVGGDINGGSGDLRQFVARPVPGRHRWRTPIAGLYLCSSSTPPGGGVHGMCGWNAAQEVIADLGPPASRLEPKG